MRQVHLWVIAPCALATFLQSMRSADTNLIKGLLRAAFIALPATIVVALLLWWWGGLTPPYVEARHAAIGNPFGFGFTIALLGMWGLFFLPFVDLKQSLAGLRVWVLPVVLTLAVALTILTPTTLDKSEGRWGGAIWALVEKLPTVADRSILFPVLAMLGALFLLAAIRRAAMLGRSFEAFIALTAIVCFTVAHAVQPWCVQRYFEPMTLVFVMWLASLCMPPEVNPNKKAAPWPKMFWIAPALLTAIQLVLTIYAVYWQTRPADVM